MPTATRIKWKSDSTLDYLAILCRYLYSTIWYHLKPLHQMQYNNRSMSQEYSIHSSIELSRFLSKCPLCPSECSEISDTSSLQCEIKVSPSALPSARARCTGTAFPIWRYFFKTISVCLDREGMVCVRLQQYAALFCSRTRTHTCPGNLVL